MSDKDEYTPQWIKDWIIDNDIRTLLSDIEYIPKQMPGEKYNLTLRDNYLESKGFKHGIKKLKSASVSMFEANVLKNGGLNIIGSFTIGRDFIKVNLPDLRGEYYLHAAELIRFFRQGAEGMMFRLSSKEVGFVLLNIDKQFFLQNCRQRR